MKQSATLITGASRGIGRAMAEHYCNKDHFVVGISRGESDLKCANYIHICADITVEQEVKNIIKRCRSEFGGVTHLINNAGMASMNHSLTTPATTITDLMNTNYTGTFLMCREVGKVMQLARYGRIVNFSTIAVPLNLAGEAAYVASKSAVAAFSRVLARELAPWNITVNVVGPGVTATKMTAGLSPERLEKALRHQMINRLCTFSDINHTVDYFLAPESAQITGQTIYLGGIS